MRNALTPLSLLFCSFFLSGMPGAALAQSVADQAEAPKPSQSAIELQCEAGDSKACLNAGRIFAALSGEERAEKARFLFGKGCELGDDTACHLLVPMLIDGYGGDPDLAGAEALAARLCHAGSAQGCSWQANVISRRVASGAGDQAEFEQVRALYLSGCDGGIAEACGQAGAMLATGMGGGADVNEGWALLNRACEVEQAQACANVGIMLRDGIGREPQPLLARDYFARGCDGDVAFACNEAGVLWMQLADASGEERWREAALRAFQKACAGSDASGCNNAARQLHMGHGVPRDARGAFDLAQRGCDLGHAGACYRAATMRRDGDGVGLDLIVWLELADRACRLGHAQACNASLDEEPASVAGAS